MTPIFLRTCNFTYNELYIYHKCILYKVEFTFPQSLFHYQHIFSRLPETLYAGTVKTLHRSVAAIQESRVAGRRLQQNGVILVHPSGGRKDGSKYGQYQEC
jgi:hypothetical protein